MATLSARRRGWAVRLGAVVVTVLGVASCADDEPSATPSDAVATSEQSVPSASDESAGADSDETERDESIEDEGTAEATGEPEDTSDPTDDQSTSEQDDTADADDIATITTTPPATDASGDEPTTDADHTAAPAPVPGPTIANDLTEEADFGTGVVASVVEVEAVEVVGRFPGERSGPGVVVTVQVDNGSRESLSLDFVTVDLVRRDGASALPVELEEPQELEGELEPGMSAVGQYQFFIPGDQRSSATLTVSYAADVPTALFTGDLPDV